MIRRFNYTNRKRIPRENVHVILKEQDQKPPSFDATIDLSDLKLPETARVFVEAYYRDSYMRFDFGTVAQVNCEDDRSLNDIDNRETIYFRVKAVDPSSEHGKILAEVDGIFPNPSDGPGSRVAILEVSFEENLGSQPWSLELSDDAIPVLVVNKRLGSKEYVRSDDVFFTLVYPSVVREILTRIIVINKSEYDADEDDQWQQQWLHFICGLPEVGLPPTNSERDAQYNWIDDAVKAFCEAQPACSRFLDSRLK